MRGAGKFPEKGARPGSGTMPHQGDSRDAYTGGNGIIARTPCIVYFKLPKLNLGYPRMGSRKLVPAYAAVTYCGDPYIADSQVSSRGKPTHEWQVA